MCIITIIIPTYNSAVSLPNALNSILNQTFSSFEILIMDAISKDNTTEIAEGYNDERIRIYSEKDSGIYDAMNKGISLAKGSWLYFLGSDDILFDENVLSKVWQYITDQPEVDVLYGDAYFKHLKTLHYGITSLERLLLDTNLCHQAVFYNRSVFDKLGKYNLKYYLYADWDFNIRCFMHPDFCIKYIKLVISTYNDIGGMSEKFINTDLDFLNILPKHHIGIQKEYFLNSVEFKLGTTLLKPFYLYRRIKNWIINKKLNLHV